MMERPGYFVGFADNVGYTLSFKIQKNDQGTVLLRRSAVRPGANAKHQNKQVTFKPHVQELISRTDLTPLSTHRDNL
jgi:hypothetical protein